jgi:MSHA biogenesis protein MshI
MYVVAARGQAVRRRAELVQGAGLRPEAIDIPELALRNLCTLVPEDAAGMAFVHLTADSGLILLTRQGTLHLARRFPSGLRALAGGLAGDGNDLPPAAQRWLDTLVVEVQRSLDYFDGHFNQAPIGNLVLAPLPMPGVAGLVGSQLGLRARQLDLGETLTCAAPIPADWQAPCSLLIGAALRAEARAP